MSRQPMTTDRIEKQVTLRAPVSRVWRAIADAQEFGRWFGVSLEGPFEPGRTIRGTFTAAVDEAAIMVEFRLEAVAEGTLLTIVESGFDRVPAHRRARAFRMNEGGWAAQADNLRKHVESA